MSKRKYTKRSEYWEKFGDKNTKAKSMEAALSGESFIPELLGESLYETVAKTTGSGSRTSYRTNAISNKPTAGRFQNIDQGILPYDYSKDFVDVSDTMELCQKAYFNIPAFRSTVDLLSEFADSEIYLEGGTKKSRDFIEAWFKKIRINDLKEQFFREYYRSANVFLYKLESKITNSVKDLQESYGAVSTTGKSIPIKYMILNPVDIGAKGSISFGAFEYVKILTPYEIARLAKPSTEHEKELVKSLPEGVRKKLKSSKTVSTSDHLYFELKTEKLMAVFAKKQDYEPLAIPMVFSVLDDMNKKMELKKIDQAIARSIENVVLLVTMGAEPDKGGVNEKHLAAMQQIFQNKSVGRVLVADYTTKAEFIIPDLKKVVGEEKYKVLNKDIAEGLQNILIGESKYADTKLKLKIFMNRLQESRNRFVDDFLQPEIKRICKSLGMRAFPKVKFTKTDTLDDSDLQKLVTRMMELGILTPEQGIKTVKTGEFPDVEELDSAQKKFIAQREEGYYMPLTNSVTLFENEAEEEQRQFDNKMAVKTQKSAEKAAQTAAENPPVAAGQPVAGKPVAKKAAKKVAKKTPSPSGRPMGTSKATEFSKKNIIEVTKSLGEFEHKAYQSFSEAYGEDKAEGAKDIISRIAESIFVSKEKAEWDDALASVIEDLDNLGKLDISPKVLDVGARHGLDDLSSAILYHSTQVSV
ncbi:transposase [bacterium]|nr:transposase [bacterium]